MWLFSIVNRNLLTDQITEIAPYVRTYSWVTISYNTMVRGIEAWIPGPDVHSGLFHQVTNFISSNFRILVYCLLIKKFKPQFLLYRGMGDGSHFLLCSFLKLKGSEANIWKYNCFWISSQKVRKNPLFRHSFCNSLFFSRALLYGQFNPISLNLQIKTECPDVKV